MKSDTCFTKFRSSATGLFSTNKPTLFLKINAIETGLSDHQKFICNFLKSCFQRLKPKNVYYTNYKQFNETNFPSDLKNCDFSLKSEDPN